MSNSTDTASISFTGLYTGEVWHRLGLAPDFLATREGACLYHAMTPLEAAGMGLGGNNLRTMLEQRHRIIDHRLEQLIQQQGVRQVLEIAAGLSPRGYRFCQQHPEVRYLETDLPGMAERKRRCLESADALAANHEVRALNVFAPSGDQALETVVAESFNEGQPLVIITEGLTSYFTRDAMDGVWRRLAALGERFPASVYLMETYMVPQHGAWPRVIRRLARVLGRLSASEVSFHFVNGREAAAHMKQLGFTEAHTHHPRDYANKLSFSLGRSDSMMRVVEAVAGGDGR